MAIYIRTRPTTKTKVLGCLCALAAAGIALLYPTALLMAAFALGSLDEAIANNDGDLAMQSLSVLIGITTVFGVVLTGLTLGVISCFKGGDRWLPKDAKVTHRDIASARFLHVAQNPARRVMGIVWAMLAGMLLVASPIIVLTTPRLLIYSEFTQGLEDEAAGGMILLIVGLLLALTRATVRRRASAVRMTLQGMAVANLESFALPLPSGRNNLSIQEVPARRGRVKVQAAYAPPTGGAEPGRPVLLSRLSLTARPSRLDDARAQVEARLDEVWRAAQLVRTPPEQEETTTAPTSEPAPNPTHQPSPAPRHHDAAPEHIQSQAENPLPRVTHPSLDPTVDA